MTITIQVAREVGSRSGQPIVKSGRLKFASAQTGPLDDAMLKLPQPFETETMKADAQLQRDVMAELINGSPDE